MENWDYTITGETWNVMPLDEQMCVLKLHYPIGYLFHYHQPNNNLPSSNLYSDKYLCEIVGYQIVGYEGNIRVMDELQLNAQVPNSNPTMQNPWLMKAVEWYNLKVRNIGKELITLRKCEYETIHIGFFYPSKSFMRNKKLELIL